MIRRTLVFIFLVYALPTLCGCQPVQSRNAVKVFINEGGTFPPALMGQWVSEQKNWVIDLNDRGSITSARISMGRAHVIPGKTTTVDMYEGGKGIFTPGIWRVTYTPSTRELIIEIEMKHIRAEMGPNVLEGSCKDIFIGTVSEDGAQWLVDWISIPNYTAYLPEPHELTSDPEDTTTALVFTKTQ